MAPVVDPTVPVAPVVLPTVPLVEVELPVGPLVRLEVVPLVLAVELVGPPEPSSEHEARPMKLRPTIR